MDSSDTKKRSTVGQQSRGTHNSNAGRLQIYLSTHPFVSRSDVTPPREFFKISLSPSTLVAGEQLCSAIFSRINTNKKTPKAAPSSHTEKTNAHTKHIHTCSQKQTLKPQNTGTHAQTHDSDLKHTRTCLTSTENTHTHSVHARSTRGSGTLGPEFLLQGRESIICPNTSTAATQELSDIQRGHKGLIHAFLEMLWVWDLVRVGPRSTTSPFENALHHNHQFVP